MPPSPSMSNEKPGATLGWPSSQVTMSYVLLGVTLTAVPSHCHNTILERTLTTFRHNLKIGSAWKMMELIEIVRNCN